MERKLHLRTGFGDFQRGRCGTSAEVSPRRVRRTGFAVERKRHLRTGFGDFNEADVERAPMLMAAILLLGGASGNGR